MFKFTRSIIIVINIPNYFCQVSPDCINAGHDKKVSVLVIFFLNTMSVTKILRHSALLNIRINLKISLTLCWRNLTLLGWLSLLGWLAWDQGSLNFWSWLSLSRSRVDREETGDDEGNETKDRQAEKEPNPSSISKECSTKSANKKVVDDITGEEEAIDGTTILVPKCLCSNSWLCRVCAREGGVDGPDPDDEGDLASIGCSW